MPTVDHHANAVHLDREVLLERLYELVSIESPSLDVEASKRITDVLAARFEAAGGVAERVVTEAGVHLVADFAGRGCVPTMRPILLVGHSDTVWPVGTIDGVVPWRVEDDVVRGPGAYDMKSGLVAMIAALEAVRDLPHRPVRVVVVADEEVGSPTSQRLIRRVVSDVDAAIGFESPHPDGALKIGRRGSTRMRLAVAGRAAHAALDPGSGVNAIDELVDQLLAVRGIVAQESRVNEVLCNTGTISGGTRANVVAAAAEAEIGLRFIEGVSERHVLDEIAGLSPVRVGARLEIETLSHRPAWRAGEADHRWCEAIARVGRLVGMDVEGRPAAGAGDANLIGALGVPTVDGFGPRGGGAHAVSEHIDLSSLAERCELLRALLVDVRVD